MRSPGSREPCALAGVRNHGQSCSGPQRGSLWLNLAVTNPESNERDERDAPHDQAEAPYAEALAAKAGREVLDLMVPGHGQNVEGLSRELAEFAGEQALRMDVPMLVNGIDVGPDSPFARATRLAAEAWSARRTWFLCNGASQANRMTLLALAAAGLGGTVVAQRSAHSSFVDGLLLADLKPRFIVPSIDARLGINHGLTPEAVDASLSEARAAGEAVAGVYVISPSYFGAVADVAGLAEVAHRHGVPLIVDGAWGAHFGFHPSLPESPTRLGADLVVSSTHKLGGSLSQSAMLHLGDGDFAASLEPLLERAYMLTQSTSASALLLGSLDVARRSLVQGAEAIGRSIEHVEACRERLRADGRFAIVSDGFGAFADIVAADPMRISIDVSATGLTGLEVRDLLYAKFDVLVELATVRAIVAFVGPGKTPNLDRFVDALFALADRAAPDIGHEAPIPPLPSPGELMARPREAYFGTHEIVAAASAAGRVSSDSLAAYPPGIPNVMPGEIITAETIAFLQAVAASPYGYVRGAFDPEVAHFRVLAE